MMKRHSPAEIRVALKQAQEMMSRGQSQIAICEALDISVMTLHRWRKEFGDLSGIPENLPGRKETQIQIDDLLLENQRLRRILTDLLLEKAKLEEVAVATQGADIRRNVKPSSKVIRADES
jgi:putative transposase